MANVQNVRGWRLAAILPMFVLIQTGCSSMSNGEKGALTGGAIGAGIGTAIGAATGNPKTGAVVGGLLGGGTGALIGNDMDNKEAKQAAVQQAAVQQAGAQAYAEAQSTRILEVIDLVRQGHDERTIINHIRKSHMTFDLNIADLKTLKDNGVPPAVINEMQTGNPAPVVVSPRPRTVIVREPFYDPYCGPPIVYARPAPVMVFGYGHGYGHGHGYGRRW